MNAWIFPTPELENNWHLDKPYTIYIEGGEGMYVHSDTEKAVTFALENGAYEIHLCSEIPQFLLSD